MITILPFNVNRRNDIKIKLKMLLKLEKYNLLISLIT